MLLWRLHNMTIQSIINGKTKIFDLAFNSMQEKQPKVLYNIFLLCVKANTNNYVFSYYLWQKCFYEKYDANIFDTRTLKLFRQSLAKFIKTGRI